MTISNKSVMHIFVGFRGCSVALLISPLNITLNLYGPEFLMAIFDRSNAARHDLRVITDTIKALHIWFQEHIPFGQFQMIETRGRIQPPGQGQICGCAHRKEHKGI